jgi:acyl-CoA thioester hydrolase
MGVVYHANYLVWMEVGRVELVRSLGINYHDLESREGLLLSVVEVECRYLAPAKYDQEVTVHTEIEEMNARLLRFKYTIQNAASGQLLTRGFTRHMWLNREFKPTKLPQRYLEMLRGAAEVH